LAALGNSIVERFTLYLLHVLDHALPVLLGVQILGSSTATDLAHFTDVSKVRGRMPRRRKTKALPEYPAPIPIE
jgi:hypothetical protein